MLLVALVVVARGIAADFVLLWTRGVVGWRLRDGWVRGMLAVSVSVSVSVSASASGLARLELALSQRLWSQKREVGRLW